MDFELTGDQEALRDGVRKLLDGRFPMARVRDGFDREGWTELADAGVFALRQPEANGGVGLGTPEAVLVFEELGRALVPGPLVATHLAAGRGLGTVVASLDASGMVEHLSVADSFVVATDELLIAIDGDALRAAEPVEVALPLDPLTPVHHTELGANVHLYGGDLHPVRVGGPDDAARWQLEGACLTAALQLGIATAVTDLAVAYAKEREQFDRPIGSFQAVKHLLADMLVRAEVARAAVYAAGVTIDDPSVGDPLRAVRAAKITAGEAAIANGKACIQVHGGMGFTWEVDAHLYLKRAWVLDTHFGSADEHAAALAETLRAP